MKAKTKTVLLFGVKVAASAITVCTASILGAVVFDGSTKTLEDKLKIDAEQKQLEYDRVHNCEFRKKHLWSKSYKPYNTRTDSFFDMTGEV